MDWAKAQDNLAIAELAIADTDGTADPRPHLEAAMVHVEAALEVFDPGHMAFNYDKAARLRDHLRTRLST
ncbi:hypothetical protein [Pseudoruegeria sp. HB172150]|uniref:hypothetical protein n=1 Tax=Pseudoruegeria sp. HB172150 TaxID=2721164 RepID=UPI001C1320F5|nr:hypothetical protein [Pseudoruegeria sp. HB172150]